MRSFYYALGFLCLLFLISGCIRIDLIFQPDSANPGDIITVILSGGLDEQFGASSAGIGVHLPDGWEVIQAEFAFFNSTGLTTGTLNTHQGSEMYLDQEYPEKNYSWWAGIGGPELCPEDSIATAVLKIRTGGKAGAYFIDYAALTDPSLFTQIVKDMEKDIPIVIFGTDRSFAVNPESPEPIFGAPVTTPSFGPFIITNIGTLEDSYDLALSGNIWPSRIIDAITKMEVSKSPKLASIESWSFIVETEIPSDAEDNTSDTALLSINSMIDPILKKEIKISSRAFIQSRAFQCIPYDDLVFMFDKKNHIPLGNVDLSTSGSYPYECAITPNGDEAWVTLYSSDGVAVIDTQSGEALTVINIATTKDTRCNPRDITFSPDGKTAYISAGGTSELIIVDVPGRKLLSHHKTGGESRYLTVSPDGKRVYLGNWRTPGHDSSISWYDVDKDEMHENVLFPEGWLYSIIISPDGKTLYFSTKTGTQKHSLYSCNTKSFEIESELILTGEIEAMDFSPDGNTIFGASPVDMGIYVIDAPMMKKTDFIDVDPGGMGFLGPMDVEVSPDGTRIFTNSSDAEKVAVFSWPEKALIKSISCGSDPMGLAVFPDVHPNIPGHPELVKKAVNEYVPRGDPMDFLLSWSYNGEDTLKGARVIDPLPDGTAYISSSGGISSGISENLAWWELGDINPGDSGDVRISLSLKADAATSDIVTNQAWTAPYRGDTAEASVQILNADFSIFLDPAASERVTLSGRATSFTLSLRNNGINPDTYDLALEIPDPGWTASIIIDGHPASSTGPHNPGEVEKITVRVQPPAGKFLVESTINFTATSRGDISVNKKSSLLTKAGKHFGLSFDTIDGTLIPFETTWQIPASEYFNFTSQGFDTPVEITFSKIAPEAFIAYDDSINAKPVIAVLDMKTLDIVRTIDPGDFIVKMDWTRDGSTLLTALYDTDTLAAFNPRTGKRVAEVHGLYDVMGMDVNTTGPEVLYAACGYLNKITIVNLENLDAMSTHTLDLPGDVAINVKFSPDGSKAWVLGTKLFAPSSTIITEIDTATEKVIDSWWMNGPNCGPMDISPDGKYLFMTDENTSMYRFNTETKVYDMQTELPSWSLDIEVAPDGNSVWVTCPDISALVGVSTSSCEILHKYDLHLPVDKLEIFPAEISEGISLWLLR
jgi:DNA-binding beta-propeller fold protein YncE